MWIRGVRRLRGLACVAACVSLGAGAAASPADRRHADSAALGTISGTVVDKETGRPLQWANVFTPRSTHGICAGPGGRFVIRCVPAGVHALKASFVGYWPVVVEGLVVAPGSTTEVNFALRRAVCEVQPVVVLRPGRPIRACGRPYPSSKPVRVEDETSPQSAPAVVRPSVRSFPNPFNPNTEIRFELPERGPVEVGVYDVRGRLVRRLGYGLRPAGSQAIPWDGRAENGAQVASGTYFARVVTRQGTVVTRLTLVR